MFPLEPLEALFYNKANWFSNISERKHSNTNGFLTIWNETTIKPMLLQHF
jgi:hypothetical protein